MQQVDETSRLKLEAEEKEALNIFFHALNEEDFRSMSTVEVFDGKSGTSVTNENAVEKGVVSGRTDPPRTKDNIAKAGKKKEEVIREFPVEGVDFITGADGVIREKR